MKIKSIAQICKKNKTVHLCDHSEDGQDNASQWIGDGHALYPISGLPYLDEENVYTIFDVPEKQRDGWYFKHTPMPEGICFDDTAHGEQMIESGNLSIVYAGRTLKPLRTRRGLVFIESRYITPLVDVLGVMELYERETPSGRTYIATKAGFLLLAVIMPYDIISADFVKRLEELTRQCAFALRANEQRQPAAAEEQEQFMFAGVPVDRETGEILSNPEEPEEPESDEE